MVSAGGWVCTRCTVGHTPTKCLSRVRRCSGVSVANERNGSAAAAPQSETGDASQKRRWCGVISGVSVFHIISDSVCAGRETSRDRRAACVVWGCRMCGVSLSRSRHRWPGLPVRTERAAPARHTHNRSTEPSLTRRASRHRRTGRGDRRPVCPSPIEANRRVRTEPGAVSPRPGARRAGRGRNAQDRKCSVGGRNS